MFCLANWSLWCVFVIVLCQQVRSLEFRYYTNEELQGMLSSLSRKADDKGIRALLYSIGNSSKLGQPLWVLEITASTKDKIGVPNVKLIGNMHGNEAASRVVLPHFIEFLIESYGKNETVTWLLNNTKLHILTSLNPDGFASAGNACKATVGRDVPFDGEEVDLNRNFPDCFAQFERQAVRGGKKYPNCKNTYGLMKKNMTREAQAIVNWMENRTFILSIALHGGQLVANYPFDSPYNKDKKTGESRTQDDDVFKHLARTYSNNHPLMHLGENCPESNQSFSGGITNGAKWYSFKGGMGDYNYAFQGCMELTAEISCCKYPKPPLENLWYQNKESLLHFCMQANTGVTGQILDSSTGKPIEQATLSIIGRKMTFQSSKRTGEFWRILLPGSYELQVNSEGYYPERKKFNVSLDNSGYPKLTLLKIYLLNTSISTTSTSTSTTESLIMPKMVPQFGSRLSLNFSTGPLESKSTSNIINCHETILLGLFCIVIISFWTIQKSF